MTVLLLTIGYFWIGAAMLVVMHDDFPEGMGKLHAAILFFGWPFVWTVALLDTAKRWVEK